VIRTAAQRRRGLLRPVHRRSSFQNIPSTFAILPISSAFGDSIATAAFSRDSMAGNGLNTWLTRFPEE
jgi:hypothetical protein